MRVGLGRQHCDSREFEVRLQHARALRSREFIRGTGAPAPVDSDPVALLQNDTAAHRGLGSSNKFDATLGTRFLRATCPSRIALRFHKDFLSWRVASIRREY